MNTLSRGIEVLLAGGLILMGGAQKDWAAACFWTDQVGDHLWSTPGNWQTYDLLAIVNEGDGYLGNVAPVSGDTVVFGEKDKDNGTTADDTIFDIKNIYVQDLIVEADTDFFYLQSSVGPLHIHGQLLLNDASSQPGLVVECPLVIEDGGSIFVESEYNSTGIDFDAPVFFTAGGTISDYGASQSDLFQTGNNINFNAGIVCTNDLSVTSSGGESDAHITLPDLTVYGNMYCHAGTFGGSAAQSTINFAGTNDNHIEGILSLDADTGSFSFSKPSNIRLAAHIDVHHAVGDDGSFTVPIYVNTPVFGDAGSTLVVETGVQLNLIGAPTLLGTVILKHLYAAAKATILNMGNANPVFGQGAVISVIQHDTQSNPQIQGDFILDPTTVIDVDGAVPSFLEIQGNIQAGAFTKTGPGTLLLEGANRFTEAVTVISGTLEAANAAALNIANRGSLHLNGGTLSGKYLNVPNVPLFVDGPSSQLQAFTPWAWGGPVFLNSTLTVVPVDLNLTNAELNFSGPISGSGGLNLEALNLGFAAFPSVVEFSGSSANIFNGPLSAGGQLLKLNKPANVLAFGGDLIAGSPGGLGVGEVRWLNSNQGNIPNVTVYSNSVLNLNNFNESFESVNFNGGEIQSGSGTITVNGPVTVNPAGVTATIAGSLSMAEIGTALFNVGAGGVDPDLWIQASVTGTSPQLTKTGPGIMRLSGANNLSASTVVQQGVLEVGNSGALGNVSQTVTVEAGATLQAGTAIANPISLNGGLVVPAGGPSVVLGGAITLQGPTTIDVAGSLLIDAPISGTGGLTKTGSGSLTLGGITANTYTGDTQVSGGTLNLGKPHDVYAVPGNLIIGGSGFRSTPATVFEQGDSTIGGSVTVNGGSLWHLDGHVHIFNTSNLLGQVPLTLRNGGSVETSTGALLLPGGDDVAVIPGNNGTSIIDGNLLLHPGPNNFIVSGRSFAVAGPECRITANIGQTADPGVGTTAQLTKSSFGTLVLSGTNNYAGNTIVSNGVLEIDGLQPQSPVQVYAGTLQGNGTVGPLELDDPNAVVAPIGLPSTLVCSNFNEGATPNGTLQIYLAGNQPGTGYSQVQASGSVNLANLNLNASLVFNSQYGDQFTIVKNNGGSASSGAFNGLPEGSQFPISGEMFQVTYRGGSGGDVVLTHLSPTNQPNVATWINGSGGDWNNGANWNTGVVPNGGFAVVAVSTPCVISNNANVSPAQMLLNSPLASITGSGNFAVSGVFEWEAGTLNGSGSLMANGGLHLFAPVTGNLSLVGQSLINSGPATWSANTTITLSGGAIFSNAVNGTFDCAADGTMQNGSDTNLFANTGLFRKIESFGTTTILTPFNNSGTVDVLTGTLDLAGGGVHSGIFQVSSGATLSFSAGTHTITPISTIFGAGEFHIFGGTVNLSGTVTTLGAHNFTGGTVNLGGNYDPSGNDLTIGASTVNFNGTTPVTAASLTVGGYGTLGGSSLISVSGPMVWNSSFSISGSNSLIANGGLTIGPGGSLFGRTLVNMASASWTNSGIGSLVLGFGAVLSNAPGATFDCMGNNYIQPTSGSGTVANAGLFRIIGPPATNTIEVPFNNSGTLEVQSGTLILSGGGSNSGVISVFANATLSLGEQFSLAPGGSITGPGELLVTGSTSGADLDGTLNISGSNIFSGGVANLTGNYVCSNVALTIGPGTANFNSSNVISPSSLALGGYGFLGGSNLVTVSGPMTWNSGFTITGTNEVIANGGLTIGPGDVTLDGRTLVNMGLGIWTNNTGGLLSLLDGAVLSNAPSAAFECVGNGTIAASTDGGLVANAGLFQTVGAPATNIIQAPFTNTALVEVQSGVLSLAGGGSSISTAASSAEISVFSNATIDFNGSTFLVDQSSIIDGPGNLSVSGGTANLAGEVDLTGTHTFSRGTANLTGLYNCISNALVISGGTANFNGAGVITPSSLTLGLFGTLGGSNLVTVNGPMTWGNASMIAGANSVIANGGLTIGSGVSLSGRTLVNAGPALWTNDVPGSISLFGGAVLSNAPGATFDCAMDGSIDNSGGSNVIFNAGLFRKMAGTNTTTISVPFINAGVVEADSGWLNFVGPFFVQDGGAIKLSGGNVTNTIPMQLTGGVLKGNGLVSGSVSNSGVVSPGASPGQITVAGDYTQLTNGSLIIEIAGTNAGSTFDRLIVNHNTALGGTLHVSLLNGFYPAPNSSFTFLISSNLTGTFAQFDYPSNDVGLLVTYTATNAAVQVINTRPIIAPIADQTATNGSLFRLAVQAQDEDLPPQLLTYALTNSPVGASVDSNGIITWTPNLATAPTNASITVLVTDNGSPSLTTALTFLINVSNSLNSGMGPVLSFEVGPFGTHSNTLTLLGVPGLAYVAQYATNVTGPWLNFMTNVADTNGFWSVTDPFATNPTRFYRAR